MPSNSTPRLGRVGATALSLASLLFCACVSSGGAANGPPRPTVEQDTLEIRTMIEELYQAFSFDAGAEPDWDRLRALAVDGARFVSPIRTGEAAHATGIEPFLESFGKWVRESDEARAGLHERILQVGLDVFANIGHAFVTFESFVPPDGEANALGLDSIQLVRDVGQWKLASFTSQYASAETPMPPQFLELWLAAQAQGEAAEEPTPEAQAEAPSSASSEVHEESGGRVPARD